MASKNKSCAKHQVRIKHMGNNKTQKGKTDLISVGRMRSCFVLFFHAIFMLLYLGCKKRFPETFERFDINNLILRKHRENTMMYIVSSI